MTVSPFDSTLFQSLFSGREIAKLFSDQAAVAQMLCVEAALARVQGRLGIIPAEAADTIDRVLFETVLPAAELTDGTGDAGVPVPALVAALRSRVGPEAGQYLHWGATSQDIMDTALMLTLASAVEVLAMRLEHSIQALKSLAEKHRATVMVARTRSQQALPMTFGLKAANWLAPLLRHRMRLAELRPRLLVVQFGGAAGTLSALDGRGLEVMEALAAELKLQVPAGPWHTQRDGLAEFAGWLSLVTGSLGKLGQDIVLMSQNEVGEIREGGQAQGEDGARGGSSTMPQKSNPVSSEVLVTAARNNATLLPALHQALLQEHERGGSAWQLEWLSLPQMVVSTVVSLKHALYLAENLEVDAARMKANLEASKGLTLAEAATFTLAQHLPRPEAQSLVKQCCREAFANDRHLIDVLAERCDAPVDWGALREPSNYLGVSDALIDRVLKSV